MKITYFERCTRQSCPVLTHLLQGLAPPIFTAAPLQYFSSYFSLAFLESCCPSSSPAVTFLCLNPMTWDPSAPFNRVASSSSTLSWSYWMYSNFFFFSVIFCFLASSLALASASLLAFWAAHFAQQASATSCNQRRDCYCSSYHRYISQYCSSSISVLFWEISEGAGKDMIIQKQEQKTSFFIYILLT